MRGGLNRQVNVKISDSDFKDLQFLRASGVNVGELLRASVASQIRKAKLILEKQLPPTG